MYVEQLRWVTFVDSESVAMTFPVSREVIWIAAHHKGLKEMISVFNPTWYDGWIWSMLSCIGYGR